jgi:hypothetical protein
MNPELSCSHGNSEKLSRHKVLNTYESQRILNDLGRNKVVNNLWVTTVCRNLDGSLLQRFRSAPDTSQCTVQYVLYSVCCTVMFLVLPAIEVYSWSAGSEMLSPVFGSNVLPVLSGSEVFPIVLTARCSLRYLASRCAYGISQRGAPCATWQQITPNFTWQRGAPWGKCPRPACSWRPPPGCPTSQQYFILAVTTDIPNFLVI